MGLACVKAQHPSIEGSDSNDMRQLSPAPLRERDSESPVESKLPLNADMQEHPPVAQLEGSLERPAKSDPTVKLEQIVVENNPPYDSNAEDQVAIEKLTESKQAMNMKISGDIDEHDESHSSEESAENIVVEDMKDSEQKLDNNPLSEALLHHQHSIQKLDSQQVQDITVKYDEGHPAVGNPVFETSPIEDLDATDGVFEDSVNNRETSDNEGQRPEGVPLGSNDSNDAGESANAELTPRTVTALDDLDLDLSESMKMRTLRSGSKRHRRSKNRRKRMRAQHFANATINVAN